MSSLITVTSRTGGVLGHIHKDTFPFLNCRKLNALIRKAINNHKWVLFCDHKVSYVCVGTFVLFQHPFTLNLHSKQQSGFCSTSAGQNYNYLSLYFIFIYALTN